MSKPRRPFLPVLPASSFPLVKVAAVSTQGGVLTVTGKYHGVVVEYAEDSLAHIIQQLLEISRGVGLTHTAGEEGIAGEKEHRGAVILRLLVDQGDRAGSMTAQANDLKGDVAKSEGFTAL